MWVSTLLRLVSIQDLSNEHLPLSKGNATGIICCVSGCVYYVWSFERNTFLDVKANAQKLISVKCTHFNLKCTKQLISLFPFKSVILGIDDWRLSRIWNSYLSSNKKLYVLKHDNGPRQKSNWNARISKDPYQAWLFSVRKCL